MQLHIPANDDPYLYTNVPPPLCTPLTISVYFCVFLWTYLPTQFRYTMDLTQFLVNAQNPDTNLRSQAQQALQQAEDSNLPVYLVSLVTELGNASKPPEARQMAGILLKNTMTSRDEEKKKKLELQWMALPQDTKGAVKQAVLGTLESETKEARQTAAQVPPHVSSVPHVFVHFVTLLRLQTFQVDILGWTAFSLGLETRLFFYGTTGGDNSIYYTPVRIAAM